MVTPPQSNPRQAKSVVIMAKMPGKGVHGNSIAARPTRTPHPAHKNRDVTGRLLPGATLEGAAPPFMSGGGQAMPPMRMPMKAMGQLTPPQ